MPEPSADLGFTRDADFTALYANNVQFEASVWDLKLVFGELDQSKNPAVIEQHTSVSLPWQQAKLTAYFLIVNFMAYEARHGRTPFPDSIIPKRPDPSEPGLDDTAKRVIEYLAWVHDQFFSANPYIPPSVSGAVGQQPPPPTE
jgi:hypothetical protein